MRAKSMSRVVVALLLAVAAFSAQASFHLMKVVEVFPGTAASPSAQYVVIQMYASGENLVGGHAITVFDSAGTLVGTFTFAGNVANGANQSKILIATSQAQTFFGVTADLTMTAALISAGGKACWAGTLDCVAWGAYTGGAAGVGTPFNAATGLESGKAAIRRLNIAGSATVLDAGDDTDNSANDFISGLPAPRNNAGVLGTVPAATCGNGALEGLEQCDDHNLVNGDGCSNTCQLGAVSNRVIGDFDGDGKADVFWRNGTTGANVIWNALGGYDGRHGLAGRGQGRLRRRWQGRRVLAQCLHRRQCHLEIRQFRYAARRQRRHQSRLESGRRWRLQRRWKIRCVLAQPADRRRYDLEVRQLRHPPGDSKCHANGMADSRRR